MREVVFRRGDIPGIIIIIILVAYDTATVFICLCGARSQACRSEMEDD